MSLCPLSKFKHLLGVPGKGAHSYRLFNSALIDYVLTLLGAFLLTYLTKVPVVLTTIFAFVLGIVLHVLFGVPTEAVKFLGLKC